MIDENRYEVDHLVGKDREGANESGKRRSGRHKGNR
jgi:hypothetical protein